jgi:nitroimidazol reductase NimA-like FMN-containing flavoprotein (pyridoxamine 5'-phosphate oxidase superfamily)
MSERREAAGSGTRLEAIDRDECLRLLEGRHLGRIGVVISDQPLVFPVNYALHQNAIVFRTESGNKLRGAIGHKVAFEIDDPGGPDDDAWSVLVVGTAELVESASERDQLTKLELGPWGPGQLGAHWVRIRTGAVTGRRIAR